MTPNKNWTVDGSKSSKRVTFLKPAGKFPLPVEVQSSCKVRGCFELAALAGASALTHLGNTTVQCSQHNNAIGVMVLEQWVFLRANSTMSSVQSQLGSTRFHSTFPQRTPTRSRIYVELLGVRYLKVSRTAGRGMLTPPQRFTSGLLQCVSPSEIYCPQSMLRLHVLRYHICTKKRNPTYGLWFEPLWHYRARPPLALTRYPDVARSCRVPFPFERPEEAFDSPVRGY